MPGPLIGPIIAAGASLLNSGINAFSQGQTNQKDREFAEKWNYQNRQWAVEDWDKQNAYNSPISTMARLKDAGLNPNLVYDNGAQAGSPAPVRSNPTQQYTPHAPQVDLNSVGDKVSQYYDIKNKAAQYDNIRAQTEVIKADAALKQAQYENTWQNTHLADFKTQSQAIHNEDYRERLGYQADAMKQNVKKLIADTMLSFGRNEREQSINPILQAKMNADLENARKEGKLKDLEITLGQMGIYKNDPIYLRILTQIAKKTGLIE